MIHFAQCYAEPANVVGDDPRLDGYARRGVTVTRDAASVILAALLRDSHELRARGGSPNDEAAATNDSLRTAILECLNDRG